MINPKSDLELTPSPTDGISDIAFNPQAEYICVTSWDGKAYIWEIINYSAVPKTSIQSREPLLCATWSPDGSKIAVAGVDKSIQILDIISGQTQIIQSAHESAIRSLKWVTVSGQSLLISASWDKTLKCIPSPLKWQTRKVACFIDGSGFAVSSIEGRVALHYVDEKNQNSNFAFKCHREANNIHAVNSMSFHPIYGTFCTAGSDGYIHFWDKDSRQRLESSSCLGFPIPVTSFSRNGALFAYALSYDWSRGYEGYSQNDKNSVFVHITQDSEVKPRITASNPTRQPLNRR